MQIIDCIQNLLEKLWSQIALIACAGLVLAVILIYEQNADIVELKKQLELATKYTTETIVTTVVDEEPEQIEIKSAVQEIKLPYTDANLSAKAYMDYKAITDRASNQYKLIHSDRIFFDNRGFLIDADGYIGVAMGSYFGDIGEKYNLYLDNGNILKVIKVEAKADIDTDEYNIRDYAGGIIEMVIDTDAEYMNQHRGANGYIYHGNFNNCEEFKGNIIKIERVFKEED